MPGPDPYLQPTLPIEALAEKLSQDHFGGDRANPEALADHAGIAYRYAHFPEEFDGVLQCQEGQFYLICNERRAARGTGRSRFTFSHELGHALIPAHRHALLTGDWPIHYSRTDGASDLPFEKEADLFATNLLLPEKRIRQLASAHTPGMTQVQELADHFGASLTATAYRLLSLNLWSAPAAIFRWDATGALVSHRSSPATVAHARIAPTYWRLTKTPPLDTVTYRAVSDLCTGVQRGHSHLMSWFTELTGYGAGDQSEVIEEVISLGQFGWMTCISKDEHS